MKAQATAGNCLRALIFGLFLPLTAANAQEVRTLSTGQSIYLPIYSHMLYGNLGTRAKAVFDLLAIVGLAILVLAIVDRAVARMGGRFALANSSTGGLAAHMKLVRAPA